MFKYTVYKTTNNPVAIAGFDALVDAINYVEDKFAASDYSTAFTFAEIHKGDRVVIECRGTGSKSLLEKSLNESL